MEDFEVTCTVLTDSEPPIHFQNFRCTLQEVWLRNCNNSGVPRAGQCNGLAFQQYLDLKTQELRDRTRKELGKVSASHDLRVSHTVTPN